MIYDCINHEYHSKQKEIPQNLSIHHPDNYKEGLQCRKSEDGYWCRYVNDGEPVEGSNIIITVDEMKEVLNGCIGYFDHDGLDILVESEKFKELLG